MTIDLYSLAELNAIGDAAVKSNLPELDPTIPGSMVRTLVSANSILIYAAQRNITAALNDFFPQTASGEFLDFWAEINALTRIPGTVAEGRISIIGTLFTTIPQGTLFASSASESYISTSAATIAAQAGSVTLSKSGTTITAVTPVVHSLVDGLSTVISGAGDSDYNGTFTINVLDENTFTYTALSEPSAATDSGAYSSEFADIPIASQDIGTDKNLVVGSLLTLQSTVSGITDGTQGVVNRDGITAGSDLEDDESLRERVLLANSIDPGVFTSAQIRLDALTIPTATRVFVTNPSTDFTTDGTDVVDRVPDGFSEAGEVATIDMTANGTANIYAGSTITVAGVTPSGYDGDWTVLTVSATEVTYTVGATLANSSVPGTVSLDKLKNIPQPGIVYVFVLDDNNAPPTPSASTLTNVKDKIIEKLPAHSTEDSVVVVGPFFTSVAVTISGLSPDSTAMRTAIENNLLAFFEDGAGFAEDIKLNQLITAIQNTQDLESGSFVEDFSLDAPTADTVIGDGSMGVLGTVTFN
jgi:uncharacterized phage protein gp47/JayE